MKGISSAKIADGLLDVEADTFLVSYCETVMDHGLQFTCRDGKLVVDDVSDAQQDPLARLAHDVSQGD